MFRFPNKIKYIFKLHAFTIKNEFRNMSDRKPDFTQTRSTCMITINNHNIKSG